MCIWSYTYVELDIYSNLYTLSYTNMFSMLPKDYPGLEPPFSIQDVMYYIHTFITDTFIFICICMCTFFIPVPDLVYVVFSNIRQIICYVGIYTWSRASFLSTRGIYVFIYLHIIYIYMYIHTLYIYIYIYV
jgi:hypothetical protein